MKTWEYRRVYTMYNVHSLCRLENLTSFLIVANINKALEFFRKLESAMIAGSSNNKNYLIISL